jgi:hypothetical protein
VSGPHALIGWQPHSFARADRYDAQPRAVMSTIELPRWLTATEKIICTGSEGVCDGRTVFKPADLGAPVLVEFHAAPRPRDLSPENRVAHLSDAEYIVPQPI